MFSRSCEYALQAVLYIAWKEEERNAVGLREIAEAQDIPSHFLSKILQQLVRHRILGSSKGPSGGYVLLRQPDDLSLLEVVGVIDGLDVFERCCIGLKVCSDTTPCPVHHDFKALRTKIKNLLGDKTIAAFIQDIEHGQSIVTFHQK